METKNTKIEEIDPTTGLGIDYSGLIQEVGIDYEAQEKNVFVSINGSPFLRKDDPELKKYQFTGPKLIIDLCKP